MGSGYGSRILADAPRVTSVLGVDISEEAVRYATRRYSGPGTRFTPANAMQFSDRELFDTIVSLETIEHLDADPRDFVRHLRSLLQREGVLIASAPTTPSVDVNPNHRHDFTPRSFRRLFQECGFRRDRVLSPGPARQRGGRASERTRNACRGFARISCPTTRATRAPLARRIAVTLRHGFNNHYSTIVWAPVDE